MQKVNHPLKARMFVGGLKSLLIDIVNDIEDIEKTGSVSNKFIESLGDVKSAIDLTLKEFGKVTVRCCEHGESHTTCDESCSDDDCESDACSHSKSSSDEEDYCSECECDPCYCGRVEDDVDRCSDCGEYEDECECDFDDEEKDLPPPPSPFRKGKLPPVKQVKLVKPVKAVKVAATKKKKGS